MSPDEIRQRKNQLLSDEAWVHRVLDDAKQQKRDEISKVETVFMEKRKALDDRLSLINRSLVLIQKECKYHGLKGFYGICPDCNYYVADNSRDGLRAHP